MEPCRDNGCLNMNSTHSGQKRALLMSAHNICFHGEIRKKKSPLFGWKKHLIWSYGINGNYIMYLINKPIYAEWTLLPQFLNRSISSGRGVWTVFFITMFFMEILVPNANSVDADQMSRFNASDLGLHCLQMSLLWGTLSLCKWVNKHIE